MLAPTTLFSANSERRIVIGEGSLHMPHGNFFESSDNWVAIEEMNIECCVDRFVRNGVNNHELDLVVYKFRRGNEIMLISNGKGGFNSVGSISGLYFLGSRMFDRSHVLSLTSRSGYLSLSRQS